MTNSGRLKSTPKAYYNYLMPFYITQSSLQSINFANEFADISVGDAWSPQFERLGQGNSVVAVRSDSMAGVVQRMSDEDLLEFDEQEMAMASEVHDHMIDFKTRGGYIRNKMQRILGMPSPDYGLRPVPIGPARLQVECDISTIFILCRTPLARWLMERVPIYVLGKFFDYLRLAWKGAIRPTEQNGLGELRIITYTRGDRYR